MASRKTFESQLRALVVEGLTCGQIAKRMGASYGTTDARLAVLGLRPARKPRKAPLVLRGTQGRFPTAPLRVEPLLRSQVLSERQGGATYAQIIASHPGISRSQLSQFLAPLGLGAEKRAKRTGFSDSENK